MEYYTSYSTVPNVVVLLIVGSFSIEMAAVHGYIDYSQPIRQTQPSACSGREIITGQGAVFCGWESNHRSGINRLPVSDTVVYPLKPRPHQIAYFVLMVPLRIYSLTTPLPPVHTSNNVGATFDSVAKKRQQRRTSLSLNIVLWTLLRHCCSFWRPCRTSFSRNFVLSTKSKQTERVQSVWTLSKGRNFVRHYCHNRQTCRSNVRQCQSNIRHCRKNYSTCSI